MEKKNLLTSLKKLLGNLVGTEPEGNNLVEVIDNAAEGSSESSGGTETFVVTFSGKSDSNNASCDKTYQEINEAYKQGKNIQLQYEKIYSGQGKKIYNIQNVSLTTLNDGNLYSIEGGFFQISTNGDQAPNMSNATIINVYIDNTGVADVYTYSV